MPTTLAAPTPTTTGCVDFASLFQDALLEDPPASNATTDVRRAYAVKVRQAETVCMACPVLATCLYRAVVEHDVAGYVAGTTPRQRAEIRRRLGIVVAPEDFDTWAGVTGRHRQVDHDEVVRLRHANPHESLECLAQRLGCSLSTIKRHLRRERHQPSTRPTVSSKPSMSAVLDAYADVVRGVPVRRPAAA